MKVENLRILKNWAYDGEMDTWSVSEGQKAKCGFVNTFGNPAVLLSWTRTK